MPVLRRFSTTKVISAWMQFNQVIPRTVQNCKTSFRRPQPVDGNIFVILWKLLWRSGRLSFSQLLQTEMTVFTFEKVSYARMVCLHPQGYFSTLIRLLITVYRKK